MVRCDTLGLSLQVALGSMACLKFLVLLGEQDVSGQAHRHIKYPNLDTNYLFEGGGRLMRVVHRGPGR